MDLFIREIGSKTKSLDMVLTNGWMEDAIPANGLTIACMEKEYTLGQTVVNMRGVTSKIKKKVRVNILG